MEASRATLLIWVSWLLVQGVTSWTLSVTQPQQAMERDDSVTVTCEADVTLTACQIMVYHRGVTHLALNVTDGHAGSPVTALDAFEERLFRARYSGAGLGAGHCGAEITLFKEGGFVVGCRARVEKGGWKRGIMTLFARGDEGFNMSVAQQLAPTDTWLDSDVTRPGDVTHLVTPPGSDVTVLCVADQPLRACAFRLVSWADEVRLDEGQESPSTDSYRYHGKGLEEGECGIELRNVREKDNGPIWCSGRSGEDRSASGAAILIVAKPPPYPVLVLATGTNYTEGQTLAAMCLVKASTPPAEVTWYMGYDVIRRDAEDDVASPDWRWPWEPQSVTQTMTLKMAAGDDGKEIRCSVEHSALSASKQSKRKVFVKPSKMFG